MDLDETSCEGKSYLGSKRFTRFIALSRGRLLRSYAVSAFYAAVARARAAYCFCSVCVWCVCLSSATLTLTCDLCICIRICGNWLIWWPVTPTFAYIWVCCRVAEDFLKEMLIQCSLQNIYNIFFFCLSRNVGKKKHVGLHCKSLARNKSHVSRNFRFLRFFAY